LDLQVDGVSQANVNKSGQIRGSSFVFAADNSAGLFRSGNNRLDLRLGTTVLAFAAGQTNGLFVKYQIGFDSSGDGAGTFNYAQDTILLRDGAANTLALRNGAAAQTFNVYGTYTSITDYKRLSLSCSASTGNATIGVPFNSVLAVTGGSATATVATVTFAAQAAAFPVGSSVTVAGVTPAGYNATAVVTASTTTSVSYASTVNAAYVSGGTATVSGSANWILQSGGHLLAGTDGAFDIGASGANRPRNVYVGSGIVAANTVDAPYIRAGSTGGLQMQGRFFMSSTADGNIYLTNNATTDFGRLQFGGTTNLFPALKRSTTYLQARLADDSAFAPIQGKLTTDTAFTSGAITDTGYIVLYDSTGTAYKVACTPV
jgi:hypothetical protein